MQIFVKNLSGETTTLDVPPSTSIAALKALLLDQKPLQSQEQQPQQSDPPAPAEPSAVGGGSDQAKDSEEETRLIFAGRHLTQAQSTLEDYNIPASSVLHLALPIRGGMESSSKQQEAINPQSASSDVTITTTSQQQEQPTPPSEQPQTTTSSSSTPAATPSASAAAPTPPKKKKNRCNFKDCTAAIQRIVGDCGFCGGHFCGKHRLLEDHKCSGLEDCKRESHERNRDKLNAERTVVVKGV